MTNSKQTEALREALTSVPDWASEAKEQPAPATELREQEPVAFEIRAFNATQALIKRADVAQEKADVLERGFGSEADVTIVPLYTSPPAQRKPLTDEQISDLWDGHTVPVFGKTGINPIVFARAIEASHGIKGDA